MPHYNDIHYMRSALGLARTGLGRVAPNPSVGCVIAKDGIVLGRARTADGGRPHAETIALEQAGAAAGGADVYVTLEPCAHEGATGSCAQRLVQAGVKRAVIAAPDPDPRTNGKGRDILRQAGIEVETGLCMEEAQEINRGFILSQTARRPLITLKTATTLDARIASASGESQWITSAFSRQYGHLERARHDGVAVGIGTVLADNPRLTSRLSGVGSTPVRIVFDTHLRFSPELRLLKDLSTAPLWIICRVDANPEKEAQLEAKGVRVVPVPVDNDGHCDLPAAFTQLCTMGLTRVLVEGGAGLVSSCLKAGLYDRLLWFRAASLLGADGKAAVDNLGIYALKDRLELNRTEIRFLGADLLEIYTGTA